MQHYIKCSKCDKLITVKSEYMVLCPHCNKKLDNSFREWNARNLGATYAKYLSEVCVSEAAVSGLSEQRRISKKIGITRSVKYLFIALGVSIVTVVVGLWGYYIYKDKQKGASINAIINDAWKIRYYEDLGATVKFPFELELAEQKIDSTTIADSTQTVLSSVSRLWKKEHTASINAVRVDFKPDFGINRESATQGILQALVQDNEMKAFEYVPSDYTMPQNVKARMFSGSYLIKAEAYQFRAVMVIKKDTVWYFMVTYLRSTPEGTILAEKFFNSILL